MPHSAIPIYHTGSSHTHFSHRAYPNLPYPPPITIPADPEEILQKNGVDPYVFVRFLHMMAKALVPIWFISWIVLLPINSAQPGKGLDGLDRFTLGNIAENHQARNWAHLVLDYVFICELKISLLALSILTLHLALCTLSQELQP